MKPEALRLAEIADYRDYPADRLIAAELRRLHQFAEDQIGRATAAEAALQMTKATHALKIAALAAQRDALLEALRLARSIIGHPDDAHSKLIDAAIAAAEGETK